MMVDGWMDGCLVSGTYNGRVMLRVTSKQTNLFVGQAQLLEDDEGLVGVGAAAGVGVDFDGGEGHVWVFSKGGWWYDDDDDDLRVFYRVVMYASLVMIRVIISIRR